MADRQIDCEYVGLGSEAGGATVADRPLPDLFCFALPGLFKGCFPALLGPVELPDLESQVKKNLTLAASTNKLRFDDAAFAWGANSSSEFGTADIGQVP